MSDCLFVFPGQVIVILKIDMMKRVMNNVGTV